MTSKEFVIENIKLITEYFPNLKCTYEYDEDSKVHLIEVLPRGEFKDNKKYEIFESDIVFNFMSKYNDSNIAFFTSGDSLISIKNPTYTVVGSKFKYKTIKNFSLEDFEFININENCYGDNNYALAA